MEGCRPALLGRLLCEEGTDCYATGGKLALKPLRLVALRLDGKKDKRTTTRQARASSMCTPSNRTRTNQRVKLAMMPGEAHKPAGPRSQAAAAALIIEASRRGMCLPRPLPGRRIPGGLHLRLKLQTLVLSAARHAPESHSVEDTVRDGQESERSCH